LEWSPENCYAWSKYAELERSLAETERARAIFELAIAQPALDMPELLWKVHIKFIYLFIYCTRAKYQAITKIDVNISTLTSTSFLSFTPPH